MLQPQQPQGQGDQNHQKDHIVDSTASEILLYGGRHDDKAKPHNPRFEKFNKPWAQTCLMFIGECFAYVYLMLQACFCCCNCGLGKGEANRGMR